MSCMLFCPHARRPSMCNALTSVSLAGLCSMAVTPGLGHHVYASYGRLWWCGRRVALHGTPPSLACTLSASSNTGRSRSVSVWSTKQRRTTGLSDPTCLTNASLYSWGTTRYCETSINLLLGWEVLKSISLALPLDPTRVAFFSHLPDHHPHRAAASHHTYSEKEIKIP
jgi:hypothetical protein